MPLLEHVFIRLLDGCFTAGMLGSAVVLVLTGIEDMRTLFGH